MNFVVIDVETANENSSSICQVGLARFSQGKLVHPWGTLINPQDSFRPFNVQLHGIKPGAVAHSPTWIEVQRELRTQFEDRILVSHTYFDRAAVNEANGRFGVDQIPVAAWIDTCRVARQACPHLQNHKLTSLAMNFGIVYGAHDAIEDARCAGEILILAARTLGLSLDELSAAKRRPSPATHPPTVR